ncbi:hypothetical protein JTE90_029345 [Oedothorax gibbosus]|uniref:Uncharacterized protein n=1 Tax=Oedothorax gibbosus TaxID=931172 RepID=A0AAV6UD17_9ARAC|nr:hypothetical protein JTE90_029345 [Oedothorax gibbosus]
MADRVLIVILKRGSSLIIRDKQSRLQAPVTLFPRFPLRQSQSSLLIFLCNLVEHWPKFNAVALDIEPSPTKIELYIHSFSFPPGERTRGYSVHVCLPLLQRTDGRL